MLGLNKRTGTRAWKEGYIKVPDVHNHGKGPNLRRICTHWPIWDNIRKSPWAEFKTFTLSHFYNFQRSLTERWETDCWDIPRVNVIIRDQPSRRLGLGRCSLFQYFKLDSTTTHWRQSSKSDGKIILVSLVIDRKSFNISSQLSVTFFSSYLPIASTLIGLTKDNDTC